MPRAIRSVVVFVGVCVSILIALQVARSDQDSAADPQPSALVQTTDGDAAFCGQCGDGFCNPRCGETAKSCPLDCGSTTSLAVFCGRCGDGSCNPSCGETSTSCPRDCGVVSAIDDDTCSL
jgi:hypothetical protein